MEPYEKCNGSYNEDDVPLYSEEILKNLSIENSKAKFSAPISIENPGENLKLRPLSTGDYERGFLQLLSQLTKVGDVTNKEYLERFYSMKACPDSYYVTVIEDISRGKIIGSATLTIEKKFIRKTALRGRLEDVVVNNEYRGKQLGKLLVEVMHQLAEYVGCYKLTLDCRDQMTKFYSEMGFVLEPGNSNVMSIRFHE